MEDPKVTSWLSGGVEITVTTHRGNGQTDPEWQAQHDDAVAAGLARWPED